MNLNSEAVTNGQTNTRMSNFEAEKPNVTEGTPVDKQGPPVQFVLYTRYEGLNFLYIIMSLKFQHQS